MSRKTIDRPADFLLDNGVLFEINRQVLHPLGLQLDLDVTEDGDACRLVIEDNRDVPDPIYFSAEAFEAGRQKYERYLEEHGRRNLQKRRQIGMVIQTGPNLPHHIHGREGEESGGL